MVAVFALFANQSNAQLLDSAGWDTVRTYYSLESALKNPDKVYKLKLTKQKLTDFPMEVLQLKNLNELILNKNKITHIPMELKELKYLQKLNLQKNKLKQWPIAVCYLPELKELTMSQNMIESIPDQVSEMKKLEVLDMWSNDLIYFSPEMAELTSLRWMDLRVIQTNKETQNKIQSYIPEAKIHFDPPCSCAN